VRSTFCTIEAKLLTDTKHRTASLRQQSYLLTYTEVQNYISVYLPAVMSVAGPNEASAASNTELPYRRTLKTTVCALVHDAGFVAANDSALETLTEMLQSCELHCHV